MAEESKGSEGSHPLQHEWTIWTNPPAKARSRNKTSEWESGQKELGGFSTAEVFWQYWNNIPAPSEVFYNGSTKHKFNGQHVEAFSLFKKDITPMWEDRANLGGGEFRIDGINVDNLDAIWNNLVLGIIGETIDEGDEITGARIVDKSPDRKGNHPGKYRMELWLRNKVEEDYAGLKQKMREVLEYRCPNALKGTKCSFKRHGD